ncbi:MAG: hypothetical protein EOO01_00855 [Chitinophagaceae bacterium]|nr:MAG: hypothetical protein EOO01_00855 [Chitinophagaceae bacterium]
MKLIIILFASVCACCSSVTQREPVTASLKLVTLPADFTIYYPAVQKIKQPDGMSCWAAALTMLYSYKWSRMNLDIAATLKPLGDIYVTIFQNGSGIKPAQEAALYRAAGLTVIQGQNPTIAYWKDLLQRRGPLSITVDADPGKGFIHALVITGLKGDGSPGKTEVTYIDPASGVEESKPFTEFIKLYEGAANWPLQIIHW